MSHTQYRIAASRSTSWYYPKLQTGNLLLSENARLIEQATTASLEEAVEHYRAVLQRRAGNVQALLGMAVIRFEQGDRVEAQEYMDGIGESNAAFVHYVRGRLALDRGDDREAKRAFIHCTKAAPGHLHGFYYLAESCFRLNALEDARAACEKVLAL